MVLNDDVSEEQLAKVYERRADPTAQLQLLKEVLGVEEEYRFDAWTAVATDFLMYVLAFCEEADFSEAKASALFRIVKAVFKDTFCTTGDEKHCTKSREESFAHFKALVLASEVFDVPDIEPLADFVATTLFRHFNAYRACFLHEQPVERVHRTLVVETPLAPPPLAAASLLQEATS
mmetsp:Transcript_30103/g.92098  ORF Transcript_30103/g.92098 Transcript_30103/m.92098 type:complete len:177 (-) Transcript_30103:95-625(-)